MSVIKSFFNLGKYKQYAVSVLEVKLDRHNCSLKDIEEDARREAFFLTALYSKSYEDFQLKYDFSDQNMETLVRIISVSFYGDLYKLEIIKSEWDYSFKTYWASFKIIFFYKKLYSTLEEVVDTIDEKYRYIFGGFNHNKRFFYGKKSYDEITYLKENSIIQKEDEPKSINNHDYCQKNHVCCREKKQERFNNVNDYNSNLNTRKTSSMVKNRPYNVNEETSNPCNNLSKIKMAFEKKNITYNKDFDIENRPKENIYDSLSFN